MYQFHPTRGIRRDWIGFDEDKECPPTTGKTKSIVEIRNRLAVISRVGAKDEFEKFLFIYPELLNEGLEDSFTALHLAAWNGNIEIASYLLGKSVFIDCKTEVCS